MSRLYASIDSDSRKTPATSRGHKRIDAHVRGWSTGVRVIARIEDDHDVFDVYATSGSSGGRSDKLVATIRRRDDDGAIAISDVPGTTHSIPWILSTLDEAQEDEGGITPEGQELGHRYVMGNVNAYCPKCSQEQGVTVLDCDYDLDK